MLTIGKSMEFRILNLWKTNVDPALMPIFYSLAVLKSAHPSNLQGI